MSSIKCSEHGEFSKTRIDNIISSILNRIDSKDTSIENLRKSFLSGSDDQIKETYLELLSDHLGKSKTQIKTDYPKKSIINETNEFCLINTPNALQFIKKNMGTYFPTEIETLLKKSSFDNDDAIIFMDFLDKKFSSNPKYIHPPLDKIKDIMTFLNTNLF